MVDRLTHFKLTIGFECGVDKSVCPFGHPEYCYKCISTKFKDAHLLINLTDIKEDDTAEKRQEMNYIYIHRKYLDVLNIRHIIILSKTGLPGFNMPVGDHPMDATLLSGFIQANVLFSSTGLTESDSDDKFYNLDERRFYEFQYKHFNILLREGNECRVCLILNENASESLRELLSNFTDIFEDFFKAELIAFEQTCGTEILDPAKELVEKTFDIPMIYPQTLSAQIPPNVIDNLPLVQKGVFEFSKEILADEPYFFIPRVLRSTSRILGVVPKEEIIWNIYQMLRNKIIIPKDLEFKRDEIEEEEEGKKKEYELQRILDFQSAEVDPDRIKKYTPMEAIKKMKSYVKKAETAEKNLVYSQALNDYRCALTFAKEFKMESDIGKIAFKILEVIKLNKEVEIKFASDQAVKAEKKKDYIKALKYLFQMRELLMYDQEAEHEKRLVKIDQRIIKFQNIFKK